MATRSAPRSIFPLEAVADLLDNDTKSVSDFATAAVRARTKGDFAELEPLVDHFEGRPNVQARILLMVDDLPKAWAAAESAGTEVDAKYWSGFYPFGRGADFPLVNETARKLVEHRRWATALDLMSHFVKNGNLEAELVIEAFTSMLREGDPEMRVLSQYEITNLVTFLRESDRVEDGTLARLEWQLLPALDSHPDTSTLQRTLSESPEFFVEVISLIYRPRTATEERTATEGEKNMAGNAWRLLHEWKRVPGTVDATHQVDFDALVAWSTRARELLKKADRLDVGESQFGQVLAYSPADEDGTWPGESRPRLPRSPRIQEGAQRTQHGRVQQAGRDITRDDRRRNSGVQARREIRQMGGRHQSSVAQDSASSSRPLPTATGAKASETTRKRNASRRVFASSSVLSGDLP
ncbi:MAG: hypothetical protein WDM88_10205 [Galbitalea sp.]